MMKKNAILIFLFLSLLFFSISCNQSQKKIATKDEPKSVITKKRSSKNFSLVNKLYLLAPEFNSKKGESFGECDCCSSNYLFLDDENFISVDYCLDADTYYTGKYKIENDTVELLYDTTVLNKEYNWDSESDTTDTQPDYFYKSEKCKPYKSIWINFNCKEKICFKTAEKETNYASVDKTRTSESFLKELKIEGILKRLYRE
jgi:hypothetical protein